MPPWPKFHGCLHRWCLDDIANVGVEELNPYDEALNNLGTQLLKALNGAQNRHFGGSWFLNHLDVVHVQRIYRRLS